MFTNSFILQKCINDFGPYWKLIVVQLIMPSTINKDIIIIIIIIIIIVTIIIIIIVYQNSHCEMIKDIELLKFDTTAFFFLFPPYCLYISYIKISTIKKTMITNAYI